MSPPPTVIKTWQYTPKWRRSHHVHPWNFRKVERFRPTHTLISKQTSVALMVMCLFKCTPPRNAVQRYETFLATCINHPDIITHSLYPLDTWDFRKKERNIGCWVKLELRMKHDECLVDRAAYVVVSGCCRVRNILTLRFKLRTAGVNVKVAWLIDGHEPGPR